MGTIAIAVAAASTALATFHHTRPIYLSINRSRICTLVTSSVTSSHSCSSSTDFDIIFAPPKPKTRTTPSLDTDSDSVSQSGQEDHHQQLVIPWIVRDENENLTIQSTPPSLFLHAMASEKATTSKKKKEKDSKVKSVASPKAGLSKAARRFYNENFRNPTQRLSKVLAAAGVASRRSSEDLIFQGCVTVNGSVCNTPQTRVHPARDVIYVNGNRLPKKLPQKVYLALNKPKGYICSAGEKETKSVISLFDDYLKSWDKRNKGRPKPRLFTVGRLDVATTGLLIVTNDGEFAQKLSHPSSNLSKEYIVTIDGAVHKRHLIAISEGTVIDAVHCTPDFVELLPQQPGISRTRLRIVVHEGRNHEVRELVKNAGLQVHSLKRMRIGGFRLPADLAIGKHIELTQANLKALGWKDNEDAAEGVRKGTCVTSEMISSL